MSSRMTNMTKHQFKFKKKNYLEVIIYITSKKFDKHLCLIISGIEKALLCFILWSL